MNIDHTAIYAKIRELIGSDRSLGECMAEVVTLCAGVVPHPDWPRLAALEYDADLASLRSWLAAALEKHSPPFPIHALWFGLSNPSQPELPRGGLRLGFFGQYDPDDEGLHWIWEGLHHHPAETLASSTSLRSIWQIAYSGKGSLGKDAEWPLSAAFVALATCSLLRGPCAPPIPSPEPSIGVAVGFTDGEVLKLGELRDGEFVVAPSAG
jgi:hypothetical protein